ncbi:hypothetical protein MPSYJ_52750 [Mycolicibacterium psychrotolerans]|uniref:Uncharacterized protein n=1 Tax=Mycolicibacterium psychrotolerans TaxID=216929 RepID=A0A7I7MHK1_9MYCO|nr:hypothetical protein MPSYJ_52750 [Mycolicibacterium psychrotolerans]
MPTTDTSIISGRTSIMGLRAFEPADLRYSALMPTIAAIIAIGISRASGLTAVASGSGGGASRAIRPPGGCSGSMHV